MFEDLDKIRWIRNEFAHSLKPRSFDDPDIAKKCHALVGKLPGRTLKKPIERSSARQFVETSSALVAVSESETLCDTGDFSLSATTTPNTIEGPFFIPDSPVLSLGGDMRADAPGKLCYMHGRVVDMQGQPLEGVRLDVWQADDDGLYEAQLGKETGYLRATYVTGPVRIYAAAL